MSAEDYITKEYFETTLDKKLENFVTKDYLDERFKEQNKMIRQHMTDLTTGFREEVRIVCDKISSVDEKVTNLEGRMINLEDKVDGLEVKLDKVQNDVTLIKDVLKEKADKTEVKKLERRVLRLETQKA